MRVNTDRSIRLAEKVHAHFGSWAKVREASRIEDGAYVVDAARAAGVVPPPQPAA